MATVVENTSRRPVLPCQKSKHSGFSHCLRAVPYGAQIRP